MREDGVATLLVTRSLAHAGVADSNPGRWPQASFFTVEGLGVGGYASAEELLDKRSVGLPHGCLGSILLFHVIFFNGMVR